MATKRRICPGIARAVATVTSGALLALAPAPASAQSYLLTDLGSLGGVKGSGATALNTTAVVVGYSFVSGSTLIHAMINDRGVVSDLGTLGGTQSWARAVNGSGWVVGWAY